MNLYKVDIATDEDFEDVVETVYVTTHNEGQAAFAVREFSRIDLEHFFLCVEALADRNHTIIYL